MIKIVATKSSSIVITGLIKSENVWINSLTVNRCDGPASSTDSEYSAYTFNQITAYFTDTESEYTAYTVRRLGVSSIKDTESEYTAYLMWNASFRQITDTDSEYTAYSSANTALIPTAFTFTSVTGAADNTIIKSNIVTLAGINQSVPMSVTGPGNPSLIKNGVNVGASSNINLGNTLQLQLTSAATDNTLETCTCTVSTYSTTWNVTTIKIVTPTAFTFTAQTNLTPSVATTSNTITIAGMSPGVTNTISITGNSATLIVNGTNVGTSATVQNGSTVAVSMNASSSYNTGVSATVTIGTYSATFTDTTMVGITTPTAFTFNTQTNVTLSTAITSNTITISGMSTGITSTLSVSGGTLVVNGVASGTSKAVKNGDTVAITETSSSSYTSNVVATVTIGTYTTTFTTTTLLGVGQSYPFGPIVYQSSGGYPYHTTISAIGTSDFTLDFTVTLLKNPGTAGIVSCGLIGGALGVDCMTSGMTLGFAVSNNGSAYGPINYICLLNTPVQLTYQRHKGNVYLFVNGTLTTGPVACTANASSTQIYVGARYGSGSYPLAAGAATIGVVTLTT